MKLSIIIPTCNRSALLEEVLTHLYTAIADLDAEIIVINDSKTASVNAVSGAPVPIRVIDNPKQGPGSARNLGAKNATGELLLFLDDDIMVTKEALAKTLFLHERHPGAAFNVNWTYPEELVANCGATKFGRYLLHYKLNRYEGWVTGLDWAKRELFPAPKLAAFYFSISKRDFDRVNGFDESFVFQGAEDTELSKRLVEAGVLLFVDPSVFVKHNECDRLTLKSRLNRTKASAYNRRTANDMGMTDYAIDHSSFKLFFYRMASACKGIFIGLAGLIPNAKGFDFLYRRIVNVLIGISLYEGYYRRDKKMYPAETKERR
jgi:GT2 family glycosyltransferase